MFTNYSIKEKKVLTVAATILLVLIAISYLQVVLEKKTVPLSIMLQDKLDITVATFNIQEKDELLSSVLEVRLKLLDSNDELNNCFVEVHMKGAIKENLVLDFRETFDSGIEKYRMDGEIPELDTFLMTDYLYTKKEDFLNDLKKSEFIIKFYSDEFEGQTSYTGSDVLVE